MGKSQPIYFVLIAAFLFICLIILINYFTVISSQQNALKNRVKELSQEIRAIQNKQEVEIKDLQKFQARKYGIEQITPQDALVLP